MVASHSMVLPAPPTSSVIHTSIAHVHKPSSTHSHTQYVVRVSDERTPGLNWTVYRRFSEFRLFRQRLDDAVKHGDMCSHCEIMSKRTAFMQFPHRRLFWNRKESVLETRRIGLNAFLEAVAKHARTCREAMTCKTRELMNQFLDVNDVRYTYLDVHMSDSEDEFRSKYSHGLHLLSTGSTGSMFASTPTQFTAITTTNNNIDPTVAVDNQLPEVAAASVKDTNEPLTDGRVLAGKKTSLPNLLDYGRGSCLGRNSMDDHRQSTTHTRPGRLSDWDTTKFQMSPAGRHSDPGTASRNELLNFGTASRQRSRPRKLHLSSAAKRIKKLEEQEAKFNSQPPSRKKQMSVLPTIPE